LVELDNTLAQLEVERANRALRELTSPSAIAAAEETLATAQKNLDDAETKVEGLAYRRASDELIDNVKAEIDLAKKQLTLASDTYRHFADRPDGDARKAEALYAMTNAQLNLNALQAKYNWYTGKPSETDVALTQAKLSAAQAAFDEAGWYLAALKGEPVPAEASGSKLAQLQQARADVAAAQARLDQTHLIAPFNGIVGAVNVVAGEYASPGLVLIILSDVDHLQVRTTDLSERDIVKVRIGDPARILVEALGEEFDGEVLNISPVASTLGGDVVYEVTLAFTTQPQGLMGGMSAEVTIGE
jgi:HlyD family secretion protein